ncbi:dirigent protein 22-like [Momordica charantia]|uniref:Dirigent protein n=1 Tax=Momordica charantia TaxID=3673 RepID=A0A6J1DLX0_MOMCH|nr:dirigent protein 22-like [Momordica charantia]
MAAKIHPSTRSMITFCFLLVSTASAMTEEQPFATNLDPKLLGLKKEKLTHFRVYWHDIIGGSKPGDKPTSFEVLPPLRLNDAAMFGLVNIFDNPLTVGPDPASQLVGKSQGLYASASQHQFGLLMAMNFAFTHGKYNGSTITILGRNPIFDTVREMPVIGGSGRFRFARGYAQATTHFFNATSLDAIVEYNIYVLHY